MGMMAGGLGGVDDEGDVVLAGDAADLAERLEGAGDVAGVGDGDELRVGADRFADVVGIDQAGRRID